MIHLPKHSEYQNFKIVLIFLLITEELHDGPIWLVVFFGTLGLEIGALEALGTDKKKKARSTNIQHSVFLLHFRKLTFRIRN